MVDFTLCRPSEEECAKRYTCYRFVTKGDPVRQAYCNHTDMPESPCEFYWPIKEEKQR